MQWRGSDRDTWLSHFGDPGELTIVPTQRRSMAGRSPFGELLVSLRTTRGLTQEGLAAITSGERISSRSITNYERSVADARMWILPHRPALRSLAMAMQLDAAQMHALAQARDRTKAIKDAEAARQNRGEFVPDGREHHIRHLMQLWQRALAGSPQMVMLSGEAGIGKTTLARHLCDTVAASHPGVMVSWGEATSRGSTIEPYLSVRHATDRMLVPPPPTLMYPGYYPGRPNLTEDRLQEIIPILPKLSGVLVSERTITDLGQQFPVFDQDQINTVLHGRAGTESVGRWDEYSRLVMSLAQEWPLLIVLEDLHWTGHLTALLLTHLHRQMQHMHNVPLMIVGTIFSGGLSDNASGDPHPYEVLLDHFDQSANGTHISLMDTTAHRHGAAFIRGLLDHRNIADRANEDRLVAWLQPRTSGQPLLTIEMIRHLESVGALSQPRPNALWEFNEAAIPPDLPVAVANIIDQRLSQLPRSARSVLENAAVMGESILPETLAPILGMETEALLELIDGVLVDQHFLLQPATGVEPENGAVLTYHFTHTVYRDYVYGSIPQFRRRSTHRKIAEQLTRDFANTDMVAMAEITNHYVLAEQWSQAQMTAYRTAQLAVIRLDWDLSRYWFDRSEELSIKARDAQQLWMVRASRLTMMRGTGGHEEAVALAERILGQVAFQNWPATEAITRHLLGEIYYDLGRLHEGVEQLEIALSIHIREQSYDLASSAEAMLSHTTYRQGRYDVAREHARRSLELGRTLSDAWVTSEALLAVGNCEVDLGNYDEAIHTYKTVHDLARVVGKLSNQYIPAINTGLCLILLGRIDEALETLTTVMVEIEEHQVHRLVGPCALYLGLAHEANGDWERARAAFERSTDVRRTLARSPTMFDGVAGLLRVAVATEDLTSIERHLSELEEYLQAGNLDGLEDPLQAMLSVADAQRHLGREDRYEQWIREAHALMTARGLLLQNEAALTSYLNNVEIHRQVQQAFISLPKT